MKKLTILTIILALLAIPAVARDDATVVAKPMQFPGWGFSAGIPTQAVRQAVPPDGDVLYHEVFVDGQYAYVVKVTRPQADTLASTFIELAIQSDLKSGPPQSTKRWQLQSRQGDLFKGLTMPLDPKTASLPLVKKLLGDDPGMQSVAMAPLKDEKSPVLSVGVVTASSLKEASYKMAAGIVALLEFERDSIAPKPTVANRQPLPNPALPFVVPIRKIPPKPTILADGQIELVGAVRTVNRTKMSLEMVVDHIRLPGKALIPRNPPTSKHVALKSIPTGVKPGTRISVVGKNLGMGSAINADSIQLL